MTAAQELLAGLERRGVKARIVSIRRVTDARERIAELHRQEQFDPGFYKERLTWFDFTPPAILPAARSIVIATVPQQQVRLVLHWSGRQIPVMVPPTYLHWQSTNKLVFDAVAELLAPHGFRAAPSVLPVKTLLVHSGLGTYGRNNLTYVSGLGSFHRPVAVLTDLPADSESWHEARMMESCERCTACRRACPTGAIGQDRFLLHAERCLTFLNEKPGDIPFPEWVQPSWHECLVGCIHCQRACPQNRAVIDLVVPGPEFSEEETAVLLRGTALSNLQAETRAKLEAHDLVEHLDVMPRNLGVLVAREREDSSPKEG